MSGLAFDLAATIRHDGTGGVADLLATRSEAAGWIERVAALVEDVIRRPYDPAAVPVERTHEELLDLRRAVRRLFAEAVKPEPPGSADLDHLTPLPSALRLVNRAAARLGSPVVTWSPGEEPVSGWSSQVTDPVELLTGAVGRSAIEFLTGPDRSRLRACPAARCVRYFVQKDSRQRWCSAKCGNRSRVTRHYYRHH